MHLDPSTWILKARRSGVQDHAQLHKESKSILGYMRLYHKPKPENEGILMVTLSTCVLQR